MKKILFVFVLAILCSCGTFAKQNLFESFPDGENVNRVYVGGTMLRLAGGVQAVGRYGDAVKNASGIEVYKIDSASKKDMNTIKAEVAKIIKKYHAEEVVKKVSGTESSEIYLLYNKVSKGNSEPLGMLIAKIDGDEASFVFIEGKIDFSNMYIS